MRRLFIVLTLTLSLGACASLPSFEQIRAVANIATASISNPVTRERLNLMERSAIVIFRGLNTWKRACIRGDIPDTCKQQIRTVQVYTLQIPPYLRELRTFVKTNDQVNAMIVFNQLRDIIGIVRSKASAAGRPLPELKS